MCSHVYFAAVATISKAVADQISTHGQARSPGQLFVPLRVSLRCNPTASGVPPAVQLRLFLGGHRPPAAAGTVW